MKDVSCVDQLSSVQPVANVQTAVPDLPVGARLHQSWEALGTGPKVIRILKEGYTIPFRTRADLTLQKCSRTGQKPRGFSTDYFWSQNQTNGGDPYYTSAI